MARMVRGCLAPTTVMGNGMAITHQATTTNSDTVGRASASFSHNSGSGAERGLFVCCKLRDDANAGASAVTYNGVGLTKALDVDNEYTAGQWINAEWWYLANPASGANTVAVTYSHTLTADEVTAVTLNGVHQADPIGASGGTTGSGTAVSHSITTEQNNSWVLGGICQRRGGGGGYTPGGSVTELADGESGTAGNADIAYWDGYKTTTTAGSTTVNATHGSSTEWSEGLVEVKEATGGGSVQPPRSMHQFRQRR